MNDKVKRLVYAAALFAICIISQVFKNLSVYITGPIINACLIISVLTAGIMWACVLSIVTPVTAYLISGSPIMMAIPAIIPCIMIGNVLIVVSVHLLKNKIKAPFALEVSMLVGCIVKALFMGLVISMILIPNILPTTKMAEKLMPNMTVFQTTFSITQFVTALIGSVYAQIIWIPLKKSMRIN